LLKSLHRFQFFEPKRLGTGGFTLIELIVVMTLITIMLGFATPQLRSVLFVDGTKKTSRWMMITIPAIKTKAIREQELMVLGISIDQNNMWVVDPQPTPTEKNNDEDAELKDLSDLENADDLKEEPAKQNIFKLPTDVHIVNVEFPNEDQISMGEVEINFYPQGYSDHAIIHLENNDGNRFSFLIEPFLSNIKRIDDYVGF
jgi:prepilin-type N-terminal cleavage/methylation domain-containing protein